MRNPSRCSLPPAATAGLPAPIATVLREPSSRERRVRIGAGLGGPAESAAPRRGEAARRARAAGDGLVRRQQDVRRHHGGDLA